MGAKGGPKTGGRKAGTPNRDKQELIEMIQATGCKHPIEGMATVAVRAEADGNLKLAHDAYKELAQYVAPKRKAIEHSGPDGQPIEHTLDADELSTEALRGIILSRVEPSDDASSAG